MSQKATRLPWFLRFLQGSSWKIKVYLNLLRSGKPLVSKTGITLSSYVPLEMGAKAQNLSRKGFLSKSIRFVLLRKNLTLIDGRDDTSVPIWCVTDAPRWNIATTDTATLNLLIQ